MKFRHQNLSSARDIVCALVVLSLGVIFARAYAPASADIPAKDVHGIAVANITAQSSRAMISFTMPTANGSRER